MLHPATFRVSFRILVFLTSLILTTGLFCDVEAQRSMPSHNATLQVNFPNAPVTAILPFYEKLTNKKIIRDGNLAGGNISVVTDAQLSRQEAIRFIDSALMLNGYAILPVDNSTLKIINYTNGTDLRAQELPVITDPYLLPDTDQVVNFVMQLKHITPEEAIATFSQIVNLNPFGAMTALANNNSVVITESTPVIRTLLNFKAHVDTPPNNVIHRFVKLERADAERVSEIVAGIIEKQGDTGTTISTASITGATGAGAKAGGGGKPVSAIDSGKRGGTTIVPYRRTNSILVVAAPAEFEFVEDLIMSFDKPSDGVNFMKRKLQYVSVLDYMPSFYNALARGTDISQREDLLEAGSQGGRSGGSNQLASFGNNNAAGGGLGGNSSAARNLLGGPDDVGTPVSHMVGNTLLIGDPQANTLIVSGSPENICVIEKLIDEIDVQPMQVYLSTVIGQLTIGDDMNYSMNALQSLASFNTPSNSLSGAGSFFGNEPIPEISSLTNNSGFPNAYQGLSLYGRLKWGGNGASINNMLRLFTRDSNFKILSRPSIYAQNNVKATISSGQRIAIPTSTLTSAGGGLNNNFAGAITSNIEFRDVVLKLEVIPLINSDNEVTLKIAQINDNIVGSQIISGNEIPTLSTQELITTVTVRSGETMVLGGLITERADETVTGLPGIRRIPLLGKLLGSTDRKNTREEMLIFIQPHIINGLCHPNQPNKIEANRTEIMDKALRFSEPVQATPVAASYQYSNERALRAATNNGCEGCQKGCKECKGSKGMFRLSSRKERGELVRSSRAPNAPYTFRFKSSAKKK